MMQARRKYAIAAAGATLSVLAGVGVAWRRHSPQPLVDPALQAFVLQDFELPDTEKTGQRWSLRPLLGKPILLNFWAPWCPPCVEEMPLLERFHQQNVANGWQVVGLAADQASAVRRFLQKQSISFPTPLAGFDGIQLSRELGNVSGGLPFTVVINAAGEVAARHMGALQPAQLNSFTALR
jgi:thiol-disulfide isomerase/thioredoxin